MFVPDVETMIVIQCEDLAIYVPDCCIDAVDDGDHAATSGLP